MYKNTKEKIKQDVLDRCFRNVGQKYDVHRLLEKVNEALNRNGYETVRKEIIYREITKMQMLDVWNAPIEKYKEGRRTFYKYDDPKFSINNQPLNENEANQLKEALETLSRFKGMPQFEWVTEMAERLNQEFNLNNNNPGIIEFEKSEFSEGVKYISVLYDAIINKKALNIISKDFKHLNDVEEKFEIHPYLLKQYNNRWFLFGITSKGSKIKKKALDKIIKIEESPTEYVSNDINFQDYFDNVIGVTNGDNPSVKVTLRIDAELWPYIRTKLLHSSQPRNPNLETLKNGYIDIRLDVALNYELESKILERGDQIEVLEPKELREKIAERIKNLNSKYQKTPK